MSLRIRRGTDAQRATTPLDLGELVFTTDTKQLYVGNGIDNGGDPIIRLGTGLAWADAECTTIIATGAALQVSADANPSLGGNLSLNSHTINGTGSIGITGTISSTDMITDSITTNDANTTGLEVYSKLSAGLDLCRYRGGRNSQTTVLAGDILGVVAWKGYNGIDYNSVAVGLAVSLEAAAVVTDPNPKSLFRIFLGGGGSNTVVAGMGSLGIWKAPLLSSFSYTVATLPVASVVGSGPRAFVTNATANTFGSVVVGGGAYKVPVYSDGTNWLIG